MKLHKSFKEFKAQAKTTNYQEDQPIKLEPKPERLRPQQDKKVATQRQPARKESKPYKSFSPVLSSTSKSVKHLMQTIKEEEAKEEAKRNSPLPPVKKKSNPK